MSALSFTFESSNIRTLGTPALPLFVALDVCNALGFAKARNAVSQHVDPEDIVKAELETNGGVQTVNCVNESGLYALIFGSKLESAKRFKKWVTSEVLPAIRKNGMYEHYVPAYLSDEQCWTIQSEVGKKAKGQGRHFQTIYRALKNHFKVPKYTHILAKDFDEAVRFIRELDFSVPVRTSRFNPEPDCRSLPRSDEAIPLFTRSECVRMMNFVYTMRYLFSDSFQAHYDMLCAVNSPLASKFYDAFHDVNLTLVEKTLASKGFDVREMDCYKSLMGTR